MSQNKYTKRLISLYANRSGLKRSKTDYVQGISVRSGNIFCLQLSHSGTGKYRTDLTSHSTEKHKMPLWTLQSTFFLN